MIMAIYANGGITSKIAFVALDSLWFWFTLKATLLAFKRKFKSHQKFMVRSYALTLSALTLRIWKQVLMRLTDLDEDTIYMIDAWLGFVPNMLIAEIYIYWKLSGNRNLTNHDKSE